MLQVREISLSLIMLPIYFYVDENEHFYNNQNGAATYTPQFMKEIIHRVSDCLPYVSF